MKTTKLNIFFFTFALSLFTFSHSFAQGEKPEAKVEKPNSPQANGESILIKDGTTTMMEFVSQGSAGLIRLPSLGTLVSYPGNNLYNSGGDLFWGSVKLGTSSSAAGWTHSGSAIYNTTLTDKVGIGTSTPSSKLSVGGLGNSSAAISGETTSGWGVYGKATTGRGVFGSANGTGGEGVIAEAHGQNGRAISGYANDASGHAGYFVGNVNISGNTTISDNIEVSGSTALGATGTPFLEIREISGTTDGIVTIYENGLPVGWTGDKTRVLCLEILRDGTNWVGGGAVEWQMEPFTRQILISGNSAPFANKPWRAIIMRMP